MNISSYAEFAWEKAAALLAIDSPSGFTDKAAQWLDRKSTRLNSSHLA